MLRRARRRVSSSGADSRRTIDAWARFWRSYHDYRRMAGGDAVSLRYLYPCLGDDSVETPVEPTYFFQDAWAFERIVAQRPVEHVDVGSHYKFVALLSKVVPVTMVDLRPLSVELASLRFREGSILDLPFEDESVPSVSSLCVVEHIGLGRYGDALDPRGTERAVAELMRIVAPGGDLYVSVPIDVESRVHFNAHRVFSEESFVALFEPFEVLERRYIYGNDFGESWEPRGGTGCYRLRRPAGPSA